MRTSVGLSSGFWAFLTQVQCLPHIREHEEYWEQVNTAKYPLPSNVQALYQHYATKAYADHHVPAQSHPFGPEPVNQSKGRPEHHNLFHPGYAAFY